MRYGQDLPRGIERRKHLVQGTGQVVEVPVFGARGRRVLVRACARPVLLDPLTGGPVRRRRHHAAGCHERRCHLVNCGLQLGNSELANILIDGLGGSLLVLGIAEPLDQFGCLHDSRTDRRRRSRSLCGGLEIELAQDTPQPLHRRWRALDILRDAALALRGDDVLGASQEFKADLDAVAVPQNSDCLADCLAPRLVACVWRREPSLGGELLGTLRDFLA